MRLRKSTALIALFASAALAASGYKLITMIAIPSEGGWDYLIADAQNRRLYVSHATEVEVIDLDTNKLAGKIPGTNGVHGIALANDLNRGFVSDGRDNQVTIFDLKSLDVIGTAKAGTNPDGILYDPFSKRVFTFNGRSADMTAIDAANGQAIQTVALGGKPEFPVTDDKGNVYVNIEDKSEIVQFDPKTLSIKNRWELGPQCDSPSGLAIDTNYRRLFPVCENKVMAIVNADTGQVITTVPTGAGTDAAAFDPGTQYAFASNGQDATLTVIHQDSADKYSVVENVKTARGARTMALDTKTHRVYLSDADLEAPAPAAEGTPRTRPKMIPGTFKVLVFGR